MFNMSKQFLLFVTGLCLSQHCQGYSFSDSVTKDDVWETIREKANPEVIPTHGRPVNVTLGLALNAIREVDIARGEIEISGLRTLVWKNPALSWPEQGAELIKFSVDIKHLWSPDIAAYNAVHAPELMSPPLAVVSASGKVLYVPNERIRFRCDLKNFETLEGSNCTLKYGSWTHDGSQIGLSLSDTSISTADYQEDPRFDILATYAEIETKTYECCPEPYVAAKFTINIRKKIVSDSVFWW